MELTIAITTHNRPELIKRMSESLYRVNGIEDCRILLYDDCSTEFDIAFLEATFPSATIIRNDKNLKADANSKLLFEGFINHGGDFMLNADSDLVFHPDILQIIRDLMPETDGILSLYNSNKHQSISSLRINNIDLLEKETIGAAGTVFAKKRVIEIIENIKKPKLFDWKWSKFLARNNIRILVTNNSFVQHIGAQGQNNELIGFDYGQNFILKGEKNIQIMVDFFEQYINATASYVPKKNLKKRLWWIRAQAFFISLALFTIILMITEIST